MLDLVIISTPELGDRSYIVHDGKVAIAVDVQRDIERVYTAVAATGAKIVAVGETHMHNDYVTGGFALASELGVDYLVYAGESVAYQRRAVKDSDVLEYGSLRVEVLHTPGHTPNHISFAVSSTEDGGTPILLSGGSLLYGSVGRTDLIAPDATESLTRSQYRSAYRLADTLPGKTQLMPTHGFGSFCSSVSVETSGDSTLAGERDVNIVFKYDLEDDFVEMLMASYDPFPAYYRHMGPANVAGPSALRVDSLQVLSASEALGLASEGSVLIDIRPRKAYLEAHVPGSFGFEFSNVFSTYYGWLHEFGRSIVLITDDLETAREAVYALGRIGIETVAGIVDANEIMAAAGTQSTAALSWQEYFARHAHLDHQLLDVRNPSEHRSSPMANTVQLPLYRVEDRHEVLDRELPVYVHCAGGYRAAAAGSVLAGKGYEVVVIDDSIETGLALAGRPGI